jgi:hypothetical protein
LQQEVMLDAMGAAGKKIAEAVKISNIKNGRILIDQSL